MNGRDSASSETRDVRKGNGGGETQFRRRWVRDMLG